jgi:hypothetical protein
MLITNYNFFKESFFNNQGESDISTNFTKIETDVKNWFDKSSGSFDVNFKDNILCDMNINNNLSNGLNKQMLFSITNKDERFTVIISVGISDSTLYHVEVKKYDDDDVLKGTQTTETTEITSTLIHDLITQIGE